jgi:apolipoprotein D and lipocalin family protein
MNIIKIITTATAINLCVLCQTVVSAFGPPPLQPVQNVDLKHYVGLWYEIAHYPNKLQEGCQDSLVRFSLRENGEIDILNSCRDKQEGKLRHADGHGWIMDTSNNARLKVSYFWPFRKEYVIIDQGEEYEYSVICTTDRKNIWIIARAPAISSDVFKKIVNNIEKQGFRRESLIFTERSKNHQEDDLRDVKVDTNKTVSQ